MSNVECLIPDGLPTRPTIMDHHIDTFATKNHWTQGSPTRPFTGIIRLYMADQLSAETAAREIVSVVNEVYYNSESALVEDNLLDLWRSVVHTSRILPRCICSSLHYQNPYPPHPHDPLTTTSAPIKIKTNAPNLNASCPCPKTTPLQHKLLALLHLLTETPTTDPIPSTLLPTKDTTPDEDASDSDSERGYGYRYHPSLSPYLGSTVFSPFRHPHASSSSSSYFSSSSTTTTRPSRRNAHPDPETKVRHKRGILWPSLPFFGTVVGEAFLDSPGGLFCYYHSANPYPYPYQPNEHIDEDTDHREIILTGFSPPETEAWMNLMTFLALMGAEGIWTGSVIEDVAGGVLGGAIEKGFSLLPPPPPPPLPLPSSSSSPCGGDRPASTSISTDTHTNLTLNNSNDNPPLRQMVMDLGVACAGIWGVVFGEDLWRRRGEGQTGLNRDLVVGISLDTSAAERQRQREAEEGEGLGKGLAIPRERWELWIGRLRGFSEMRGLRVETRRVAAEAAGVMERAWGDGEGEGGSHPWVAGVFTAPFFIPLSLYLYTYGVVAPILAAVES
ncbi:hypothetical protein BO70DRAFT_428310 [Aspergillus heteromorphus CBS 117.55]|uniref:Uncharacterized protein n=1 Tax=Aspergillus heteromorphus CBS 117.55 TaxID=1448321 RepID=A0A317WIS5_9EURO|nr:uncharacterized protein BO70DRAFT_428310 [Aspergillus heteromorphus CBS 117.55]PWY86273.1 hypothetical protein BO70DRAFT_428310 [Aspergillus heteromorphus CBS 117.55]